MEDRTLGTVQLPPVEHVARGIAVRVIEGPDAGATQVVTSGVTLGSSRLADLTLQDRAVSRLHVSLWPFEWGLRLRDEDSRNGTWLDGVRVESVVLPIGATFRIGESTLVLEETELPPEEAGTATEVRSSFGRFRGRAALLQRVYDTLRRAARTDATVLVTGESGTGKELIAEAVHAHSPRADGPFVVVDAGALSPRLVESELFGHERGAFTGAVSDHQGAFERAHGGTLFLDEVGELPLDLQPSLLRVLDRGELRRVGGSEMRKVDVRVVAATHRNLERAVEDGRFRLDLFHRLAVVHARIPPLRQRPADIETLARHFLERMGGAPSLLTPELLDDLRRRRWPGNVRQLRNVIERLVLLGPGFLDREGVDDPARSGLPFRQARALALEAFVRIYVEDMLDRHDGNVGDAAEAADIARRYFQRLQHGK